MAYGAQSTLESLADPKPNMRFTEMYAFFVTVIARPENSVVVVESTDAADEDAYMRIFESTEEMLAAYTHSTSGQPWVRYLGGAGFARVDNLILRMAKHLRTLSPADRISHNTVPGRVKLP